jgi:hypothetical protein
MRPKPRGLAQHCDLPGWLEESYPARCEFVCDGRSMAACSDGPHRMPLSGALQLRASGNCCCCCRSITKCTQNTAMIEIITHGGPCHFCSNKYRLPGYNLQISRTFSGDFCSSLASIALEVNRTQNPPFSAAIAGSFFYRTL